MKPPIILGINAGAAFVKAALVDSSGNILESAYTPVDVLRPFDGACEMNAAHLWFAVCSLSMRLADKNPAAWREMEAMAITAQGDGLWLLDEELQPYGNAILGGDTRARSLGYAGDEELEAMLARHCSTAMFAGAFPLILAWIKRNDPERYRRAAHVLRCKDYLNLRLTGRIASDYTDFSTAGINIFTKRYVPELFAFLGIPEALGWMPELLGPADILGYVTDGAARETKIPAGTPVICGAIEAAAMAFGAGLSQPGDGFALLGASHCCEMLLDRSRVDPNDRSGSTLCSVLPEKYIRVMASANGVSTIEWAKEVFAPHATFAELEARLANIPPGSRGIIHHPYLCGERAPFRNGAATGGFFGLTAAHTKLDMLRAVYEGMALSLKDCFCAMPNSGGIVYISGNGAAGDFVCGLIASALGRRVARPRRKELALHGIVKTAKLGLGLDPSGNVSDAVDIFLPDAAEAAAFEAMYGPYTALRDDMREFWSWRVAHK